MENRANYFLIGIFVFTILAFLFVFLFWLGGKSNNDDFKYYKIYTNESVAGLGIKAPVKFLGVEVGSVENISLSDDGLTVVILVKIQKNIAIKAQTYASIQFQGITGLKFIQLQNPSQENNMLDSNGTILFKEGILSSIDKQGQKISNLLETLDTKTQELLKDENLKNLENTLTNLSAFSLRLNQSSKNLEQNFIELNKALITANKVFTSLNTLLSKANQDYDELSLLGFENLNLLKTFLLEANSALKIFTHNPAKFIFQKQKKGFNE